MKPDIQRKKNILPRLKVWLLQGKTITDAQSREMFRTNRLSEYIRRLRVRFGMKIKTEMMVAENGDVYGKYSLEEKEKVSRVSKLY